MATRTRITTSFTARSTAAEVIADVDLTGRRAVITGGASGIGVETARALAGAGAEVTLAVRDTTAGHRTAEDIRATTGAENVRVTPLDLTDPASVRRFVAEWQGPLHMLVNNAGVMATPEIRTPQGWELQFATNHLGHFALATGLHGALAAAGGARVVSVSSSGHLFSPVLFDDLHFIDRPYDTWLAYGQSKTANVLFAVEAGRWSADGIMVNSLMPGGIRTNLMRHVGAAEMALFGTHLQALVGAGTQPPELSLKTVEQGAATSVLLAASPALDGISGRYFEDCEEAPRTGPAPTPGSRRTPWTRKRPRGSGMPPSDSWPDLPFPVPSTPLSHWKVLVSKTWFVTGSSRGFGRSFVEAALDRGDRVAATARNTESLMDLAITYGEQLLALPLDVTDKTAAFDAVHKAHAHFGRLDVVVNNAGYGHFGMVEELTEAEARDQMETNFFGVLWVTQAALPLLRTQGGGHIVQVSSVGGVLSFPSLGVYAASKWAVEGLSEALAAEVAGQNIKVTLVEPGPYPTDWPGASAVSSEPDPLYDGVRQALAEGLDLSDMGDPKAVGPALLTIVDAENPPLRVFFGRPPIQLAKDHYARKLATWAEWEHVSLAAHG